MAKKVILPGFIERRRQNYQALDGKGKRMWWGNFFVRNAIYIIILILVLYVQHYSIANNFANQFLSFNSLVDIMNRASSSMFLALGVGGIIVLTGTDLSAGRIMGLTACIAASLLQNPVDIFPAKMFPNLDTPPILAVMLLVMVIGGLIGLFNGFFVSKFKLHPFIVTLSTMIILNGVVLWYVQLGTNAGGPISGLTAEYGEFVRGTIMIFGTPVPHFVFFAIIATAIMWFIWNKTTLGKNMYAVGANPEAARVSGVSVTMTTIAIFTIAGVLYGFSGFVEAARIGSNGPNTGVMAELDAIAACVIGGVSFTGGVGRIRGIVTGVILLQVISVALQWLGVSSDVRLIITGAIILAAVSLDMRKYLAKK
jgi:methyl-galactoside transport system permease protein